MKKDILIQMALLAGAILLMLATILLHPAMVEVETPMIGVKKKPTAANASAEEHEAPEIAEEDSHDGETEPPVPAGGMEAVETDFQGSSIQAGESLRESKDWRRSADPVTDFPQPQGSEPAESRF